MEPVKYFYESYENRELPEKEQGYAMLTLVTAKEKGSITDHLVNASLGGKNKIKISVNEKTFELNKRCCPKLFNVIDPLTDEVHKELDLEYIYNNGQFSDLYEEISNAIGDSKKLREGIKKK